MAEKVIKTKKAVKVVAKPAVKKVVAKKVEAALKVSATAKSVSVDLYDTTGKVVGKIALSEEIFGGKVNKKLLAQAIRVYLANQRQGNASTKTRGEVEGSTRKIYKQKGTGKARHGSVRAPIFVKGGIVFGPKPRDFGLVLPQKMRQKALFSALAARVQDNGIKVVAGLEALEAKTKVFVEVLEKLAVSKKILVIMGEESNNVKRATRNIQGVLTVGATRLNAYEILRAKHVIVMKDAVAALEKRFGGKE